MTAPLKDSETPSAKRKKDSSFLAFLAWWNVDPDELNKQVAEYHSRRIWQTARGISAILCALSVLVTLVLGAAMGFSEGSIVWEVVIWAVLGTCMYRGQRWSFVAGLVLWTIEKAALAIAGAGRGAAPFVQIIWWAIYMNAFYLALVVENRRAREAPPADTAERSPGRQRASDMRSEAPASGTSTGAAAPRQERPCPWCAELVVVQARYCKHCHRDIPATAGEGAP